MIERRDRISNSVGQMKSWSGTFAWDAIARRVHIGTPICSICGRFGAMALYHSEPVHEHCVPRSIHEFRYGK